MTEPAQQFAPSPQSAPAAPVPAAEKSEEKGNWFHRNRWFTKEPATYTAYQLFRSAIATIPYGIGMATVHQGMGLLRTMGERWGFNGEYAAKGITGFDAMQAQASSLRTQLNTVPTAAKDLAAMESKMADALKGGMKARVGRNLARFAGSPINQALQIGVAFTMFRFVGGLIKGQRDKVMNENNTAEDTNRETRNWWQNLKEMWKTNLSAEMIGTPVAALTLGFASANFKFLPNNTPKLQPGEKFVDGFKRAVLHPEARLIQNAAIWTVAYSIFFEAAERIFKDMQLKRGKWQGNSNSLKNAPHDPNVGGYAAEGHTHEFHQNEPPPKPKLDILTGDPSICRFMFRRVLPVAVGITAYAVAKRSVYLATGDKGGPMTVIDQAIAKSSLGEKTKIFTGNAIREGLATGTFGVLWMATDAWGTWYDKFFEKLQGNKEKHKPLTPEQAKNHDALLQRLNAKEQGAGRAA